MVGNFGTCLADHLADMGNQVTIWARDRLMVESINAHHINSKYMPDVVLSANLKASSKLDAELIQSHTVILMSIPTQHMRSILQQIKPHLTLQHLIIFVNKGIETSTLQLPSDIATQELGADMGIQVIIQL